MPPLINCDVVLSCEEGQTLAKVLTARQSELLDPIVGADRWEHPMIKVARALNSPQSRFFCVYREHVTESITSYSEQRSGW